MSNYENDNRLLCKYGDNCYQKNPKHHERFKHIGRVVESQNDICFPDQKRKLEDNKGENSTKFVKKEKGGNIVLEDKEALPPSPKKIEDNIFQKFLMQMPKDFYDFWDFCTILNGRHPEEALNSFGLWLVGPYDILSKKLKYVTDRHLDRYLCHWRYYYDPPEFQTVIAGENEEFHIGYFRDEPSENPVFVASMSSSKPGIVQPMKEDLICSVYSHLLASSPSCSSVNNSKSIISKLEEFTKSRGYDLKSNSPSESMKARNKNVVAKSFHRAGIVVPVNKNTDVGYREIPETDASLRRIFKKIADASNKQEKAQFLESLQELMTNAQWATDEGDFGMGLELGLDLFTYGCEDFHPYIRHLLTVAYDVLQRKEFGQIIKAHLANRRRGNDMSAF